MSRQVMGFGARSGRLSPRSAEKTLNALAGPGRPPTVAPRTPFPCCPQHSGATMSLRVLLGCVASSFVDNNLREAVASGTCLPFGPNLAAGAGTPLVVVVFQDGLGRVVQRCRSPHRGGDGGRVPADRRPRSWCWTPKRRWRRPRPPPTGSPNWPERSGRRTPGRGPPPRGTHSALHLRDIWHTVAGLTGLDPATTDRLLDLEVHLEHDEAIPIAENLAQVRDGDLLVSDTYLPPDIVRSLLRRAGLERQVALVVSNDGKFTSRVWPRLLAAVAIRQHLGD